jgi:four helix bundle protein
MNKLEQAQQLQGRTQRFAADVIRGFSALPRSEETRVIGRQFLRSGTSTAANYRAVCRARSRAEFISKIAVVVEEADETLFWIDLLVDAGVTQKQAVAPLRAECAELLKIFSRSLSTAKSNR